MRRKKLKILVFGFNCVEMKVLWVFNLFFDAKALKKPKPYIDKVLLCLFSTGK